MNTPLAMNVLIHNKLEAQPICNYMGGCKLFNRLRTMFRFHANFSKRGVDGHIISSMYYPYKQRPNSPSLKVEIYLVSILNLIRLAD